MLFCLIAASRPNPTICLVRVSHASCSPTALSSSKDLPRRRSPSFVSARLEHGAGAVRSSQPALATPRAKQDHVQARRYGMAPKGPRVVPSQPARRVALPSSPTETLRLCEPYGMPTPTVPGVVSSVTILPLLPRGRGETPCLDASMWYLRQVSYILGQIAGSKIADPTASVFYWNALAEVRMRACTQDG